MFQENPVLPIFITVVVVVGMMIISSSAYSSPKPHRTHNVQVSLGDLGTWEGLFGAGAIFGLGWLADQ